MNKRHEGSAEFLIPRGHVAEWLELGEEPLHLLAQLVLLLVIIASVRFDPDKSIRGQAPGE